MGSIEEIKTAIIEREEDILKKFREERIVERENLKVVKERIHTDVANIITGVRRCGKSIFAFQLFQNEKFGYVNFEDERLEISSKELNKVLEAIYSLKGKVDILVFDEIQNVNGWERFVARLLPAKKVVITGSNARLLSRELATFLTGRHIDHTLFPFSFREYLEFNDVKISERDFYLTESIAKIKNLLFEYLKKGGFPLVKKLGTLFLTENYRDVIERDIVQRFKVKNDKTLREISKFIISNSANEITYNSLGNSFGVSVRTISKWVEYLKMAFLVFELQRFSPKLRQQFMAPRKVYCVDNGITNVIGFKISENLGKLMENLVAVELLRRKSYWFDEWEIYYWKNHQQNEIDFVVKEKSDIKQLIQVTYASKKDEIERREIRSLIKGSGEFKCNDLLIITWDYEDELKFNSKTIKCIPLWKWLLRL